MRFLFENALQRWEDRGLARTLGRRPACRVSNSAVATLVERHSRFTVLCKVQDKRAESVVQSLITQMRMLPERLRKSLTWDRGQELAAHKRFTMATNMAVYFCDPSSPWQRGTNENTNGLLRQYFPKGTTMAACTKIQSFPWASV